MKYGFSQCNFPHRNIYDNINFAKENGFDFLEIYWEHAEDIIKNDGENFANAVKASKLGLTIHHAFLTEEKTDVFKTSVSVIKDWNDKYGLLDVLSFDTWVERKEILKHLLWVLELFSDTDVIILTEDCPVNDVQFELWSEVKKYKNYGLLLDIGHMNVRLSDTGDQPVWCLANENEAYPLPAGNNTPDAFYNALRNKPVPVYQLHVHNNNGEKDAHDSIRRGTADYKEIIKALHLLGYEGFVDFELVPELHNKYADEADKMLLEDFEFWKNIRRNVKENEKEE